MKAHLHGQNLTVDVLRYTHNPDRIAIALVCENGEDYCVATVNMPEVPLEPDEVLIKGYSENRGVYKALLDAGVIAEYHKVVPAGFAEVYKCKLLCGIP